VSAARATRAWFALAVFALLLVGAPRWAFAQWQQPRVTVSLSQPEAEVGEAFTVELVAMVEQGAPMPEKPSLRAPAGFNVDGPRVTTQQQMSWVNGRVTGTQGLRVTWMVTGQKPGRFTIPAPSFDWNRTHVSSSTVTVVILPASGRPRQPAGSSLLPGGPGAFGWPFNGAPSASDPLDTGVNDTGSLALDEAPDPQVFLRAVADKKAAVVGEQVTVSFYLYQRVSLDLSERKEAPLADFVRAPMLKNPGTEAPVTALAGGERYLVRVMDRVAIFPVKTGDLHTGQMTLRFGRRGRNARLERQSEDLVIRVVEPPKEGRPAGYQIGDVGRFRVEAQVAPRKIEQGGTVAVTVRVSGEGNLPQAIQVPARTGIEWLDPEKRESIEPNGDVIQGYRTFGYAVRVEESGSVDLGAIELPFWNPAAKRYEVARAPLGALDVTPMSTPKLAAAAAAAQAAGEAPEEALARLPAARAALGAYEPSPGALVEGPWLWLLLAAPPAAFGLVTGGARAGRLVRERRRARKGSAPELAAEALREAERAAAAGDAKAVAAAATRAVHHAIEGASGVRARGVLLAELPGEMAARGLPDELGKRAREALEACEAMRFDPDATPGKLGDLVEAAAGLVRALGRAKAS
jgi:hypothetical protein